MIYQMRILSATTIYKSGLPSRCIYIQPRSLSVQSNQSANQSAINLPENTNNQSTINQRRSRQQSIQSTTPRLIELIVAESAWRSLSLSRPTACKALTV